jgi:hypothetical protein
VSPGVPEDFTPKLYEAGALGCGRRYARSQDVTNAEACKGFAAGVHEQVSILLFLNTALFEMAE